MKKNIIIFLVCLMLILGSCHSQDNSDDTKDYDSLIQVSADIDFGDTSYNIETDSQDCFDINGDGFAAAPEGYYTFGRSGTGYRLMYLDRESGKCFPVCSKADCSHDNAECDSYFGNNVCSIRYNEGSLYTVVSEINFRENTVLYSLYRISLDGSVREKLFDMFLADGESVIPSFNVHRGYVYYEIQNGEDSCLYMRGLDNKESEMIYKGKRDISNVGMYSGYGEGIMFTVDQNGKCKVLYYSQTANELFQIAEDVNWSFAVIDDCIVCTDGSVMKKINLSDLKAVTLEEEIYGYVVLSSDGRYIYVDNINTLWNLSEPSESDYSNRKIDVYDIDGNLVDTIALPEESNSADFGDEAYMFFWFKERGYCILDKSQIGTGNHEWTEIDGLQ